MEMMGTIHCRQGQTILQACREQGIWLDGVCGGSGSCGKCKVKLSGTSVLRCETDYPPEKAIIAEPTAKELRLLTGAELAEGFRLACVTVPERDCYVQIPNALAEEMAVVTESSLPAPSGRSGFVARAMAEDPVTPGGTGARTSDAAKERSEMQARFLDCEFAIVVDLGTTTLAMQLVACDKREVCVLAAYAAANGQRSFGADVLSRIEAANDGQGQELRKVILSGLAEGICQLLAPAIQGDEPRCIDESRNPAPKVKENTDENGTDQWGEAWISAISKTGVSRMVIAGNTTMVHLLMGYSCEMLGRAPFRPVSVDSIRMTAQELFGQVMKEEKAFEPSIAALMHEAELFVFPGISAFVGGDIVSGMYVTGIYKSANVQMLLDLGTNGEIVIGNRMRMLAASTAAGPAFEGGGICCGCAGVKGAVCGCRLSEDGSFALDTIGGAEPVGICGSGLFEILYELLRTGRIDETGLLDGGKKARINLYGDRIYLTQQDIRQFQMAKAAVRAGMEALMQQYGVQAGDIDRIYIAGGFGYSIDLKKAAALGLFPEGCEHRLVAAGNTSLAGCRSLLMEKDMARLDAIRKYTMHCNLAEDDFFKEEYLKQMYFPSVI